MLKIYVQELFTVLFTHLPSSKLQSTDIEMNRLACWKSSKLALGTQAVGGSGDLCWVARGDLLVDSLVFLAHLLDTGTARSRDGGSVAVVGVNSGKIRGDRVCLEASDDDLTWSSVSCHPILAKCLGDLKTFHMSIS